MKKMIDIIAEERAKNGRSPFGAAHGSETPGVLVHAAELLEEEAACLAEGHTIDGRWEQAQMDDLDRTAKAHHDDMLSTAEKLRLLASQNEPSSETAD